MKILGVSCYYHDSAACLIDDGRIVAAAQEERFTRKKHDAGFPENAVRYCLAEGQVGPKDLAAVAFYDKPLLKFHRLLETYFSIAPKGLRSYLRALPLWLKKKLWIPPMIQESLEACGVVAPEDVYFPEHHESHAASAFFPSPFDEAAVLTLDGVGEWATTTVGVGEQNRLRLLQEIRFPHSLGLLYSAFTYFTGFKVNSGEYKLMGLAPYGQPVYADKIRQHLIDVKADGSFRLNLDYFGFLDDLVMTSSRFEVLFDGPPRRPESRITRREMDLARSIQDVLEEVVIMIARHAAKLTGKKQLCMAGGVALNCVANGRLWREKIFDEIWVQPGAGDCGGAIGAALAVWHNAMGHPRNVRQIASSGDGMSGAYLGPEFPAEDIKSFLDKKGYPYRELEAAQWAGEIAERVADGNVVGLCHGRMEFGPRSLGNRSIIGDARSPKMQSIMNLKIKHRESFRPFAPSCLAERVSDYFEFEGPSPYMLMVAPVRSDRRKTVTEASASDDLIDWVNRERSDLPAITHVDYSARLQTVDADTNPQYHEILREFEKRTGYGVIINTSFNVRGEPIVCTPEDAYRCFMRTEMDYLVLGPFLLTRADQPPWQEQGDWRQTFALD